jgi:hypothetical protein
MPFQSVDEIVDASTNGRKQVLDFSRTLVTGATSAAGRWHEALSGAGTGGPFTLTGTAGAGVVCNRLTAGALPLNADVTPATRHVLNANVITSSTTAVPSYVLLTDIIHMYRSCSVVTTPTTLTNHPTWGGAGDTRMSNANGVYASVLMTTASTAAAQLTLTYTNQAGTAGRTTTAPNGSVFGPVAATPAGCFLNQTTVTATTGGLFSPLSSAGGVVDTGVQRVDSYAINASGTGGSACIILHRPIAWIPVAAANSASVLDFLTGVPGLPRIYDDACLAIISRVGGAYAAGGVIEGQISYVWN